MIPIKFQVVGEEDYALVVTVNGSGEFEISSGTYTTERPRHGKLSQEQENELTSAIEALGTPAQHPMPAGEEAFEARLTIGTEGEAVTYSFWEGALAEDAKLKKLVRLLEML